MTRPTIREIPRPYGYPLPRMEPAKRRPVHPAIVVATILGLALGGWLAFCWIVDLAMVVAR